MYPSIHQHAPGGVGSRLPDVSQREGVIGEAKKGAAGGGGARRSRGPKREVGEERRRALEPARWRAPLLRLEGRGSRLRRRRGGEATAPRARNLRRGLLLRVSQELRRALAQLSGIRPQPPRVRAIRASQTALRTGGRILADRGLRAGGDRGPCPSRRQLALRRTLRAGAGAEPAALQQGGARLPYRLQEPRTALGPPRRRDLRPLPRANPRR